MHEALKYQLETHYQLIRVWHVRAAVASIHFGASAGESEIGGNATQGWFRARGTFGRRRDFWSPQILAAAVWLECSSSEAGDWLAWAPAVIQESIASADFFAGPKPWSLRWATALGVFTHGERAVIDLEEIPRVPVGGRWPYRSPGGTEALSLEQEYLITDLASFGAGDVMRMRAGWADVLLAPPYCGGTVPPRPENVQDAARRLAQVNVDWPTWAADLARPRTAPAALEPLAALFVAVRQNSVEGCSRAIVEGADVNKPASKSLAKGIRGITAGMTCLQVAISRKDCGLAEWLLDRGALIELPREGHLSHWAIAVHSGSREMCELLLRRGVDPHAEPHGKQLFGLAKSAGNLDVVRLLLDIGAALPPEKAYRGMLSTRELLARLAREAGDEALALRIESHELAT